MMLAMQTHRLREHMAQLVLALMHEYVSIGSLLNNERDTLDIFHLKNVSAHKSTEYWFIQMKKK